MGKWIVTAGVIAGGVAGGTIALGDGVGVQIVFAALGAVIGTALGGFVSRLVRARTPVIPADHATDGLAPSQRALNDHYWIDRGHLTAAPGQPRPEDSDTPW